MADERQLRLYDEVEKYRTESKIRMKELERKSGESHQRWIRQLKEIADRNQYLREHQKINNPFSDFMKPGRER